ncbi:hypothetical protein [Psychrobacter okhotskensis]|uniref:hypothetical protein n=1 Tax=Psychrobacter okhotskensis TaxID=212403 RepID=UPI003D01B43D
MGIIYDTMRQNFNKEEEEYTSAHEDYNLISFCDFISLLELHTDDDSKMVCEYLINEDKFLKLDIYTHDMTNASVDQGFEGFIGHKYDAYHEYDGFKFNEELEYPTEDFLEAFMLENGTRDYDDYYFWNIDDLLDLDCIADIGLNKDAFQLCISAMNGNARIVLELTKQNKELMASLNELHSNAENNEVSNLLNESEAKEIKIDEQEKMISDLLRKVEDKRKQTAADNNQPLHPRIANNASKIIAALTSELLKMDLTQPFASNTNGKIRKAIERQGNTMSKDVIAHWLKLAHENSR